MKQIHCALWLSLVRTALVRGHDIHGEGHPGLRSRHLATCVNSRQCGTGEYCMRGACQPQGTCRNDNDCLNPWNTAATGNCPSGGSYTTCDNGQCTRVCGEGRCPRSAPFQDCSVFKPCDWHTGCANVPAGSQCVNVGCGDCRAVFFDPAGFLTCTDEVEQPGQHSEGCRLCAAWEYCREGDCERKGYCKSVRDCQNPANVFTAAGCPGGGGYLVCEDSKCQLDCSTRSTCPPGKPRQSCNPRPCLTRACSVAESCYDDMCGGCTPVFFDQEGEQVCTETMCFHDRQCDSDETCVNGRCKDRDEDEDEDD